MTSLENEFRKKVVTLDQISTQITKAKEANLQINHIFLTHDQF